MNVRRILVIFYFYSLLSPSPTICLANGTFWDSTAKNLDCETKRLIRKSAIFASQGKQKVSFDTFNFFHLDYRELEALYQYLYFIEKQDISSKLAFEVRDHMLRKALEDPIARAHFRSHSPDPLFQEWDDHFFSFHRFSFPQEEHLRNFNHAQIIRKDPQAAQLQRMKISVLHAAFEAPNASVGGLGEFLRGIVNGENQHKDPLGHSDLEGMIITPFYDFLKKKHLHGIAFMGSVEHEVDGKIYKSTLYELVQNNIRQFLVQVDPNYRSDGPKGWMQGWEFFDVVDASRIYTSISPSKNAYSPETIYGSPYFCSAVAATSALYCGPDGNENIDILQLNCYHFDGTAALMRLELNKKRAKVNLPKVATVATTHDTNFFVAPVVSSELARLGVAIALKDTIDKQVVFNVFSDLSTVVSEETGREMLETSPKEDLGLGVFFKSLQSMGKFFSINNGINLVSFDPRNPKVLGTLHVDRNLSNLFQKKIEAKRALYEAGIIGSDTKPLFLYVGRIAWDKGIDVLTEFAKYIVTEKAGQFVILANVPGDLLCAPEWIELSRDPLYKGMIKVYLDRHKDQLEHLQKVGAEKKEN